MPKSENLLDAVCDRDTFIAFVRCLAEERTKAQQIETTNPDAYIVDGALGWANSDIQSYLWACLEYFEKAPLCDPPAIEPSWRAFADFLYCGKIIE
ncbi:MAG: hypothetical protein AAFZ17_04090 [Cyanobacteria bacterium J06650_10]